ncbi:hypothetical protein BCAR13_560056 [Paraburkholderia caribensis]|nr:hypothetical protein BCAR13_560056 [Paraburkholderia caribensis]
MIGHVFVPRLARNAQKGMQPVNHNGRYGIPKHSLIATVMTLLLPAVDKPRYAKVIHRFSG